MSEKKVKFSEGDLSGEFSASMEGADNAESKDSRFKNKHSLDSDEEDNPDNYDLMKEDDIEGELNSVHLGIITHNIKSVETFL